MRAEYKLLIDIAKIRYILAQLNIYLSIYLSIYLCG